MATEPVGPKASGASGEPGPNPHTAKVKGGEAQASFLPADQHFRRQIFLNVAQGHMLRSTFELTLNKAERIVKETDLLFKTFMESEKAR
jgi:hypothetical protein